MPEFKNTCTQKTHYMYNITGKKKSIGLSEAHNELFSNFPDLQYVYPSQFSSPHPPSFKLVLSSSIFYVNYPNLKTPVEFYSFSMFSLLAPFFPS